MGGIVAAGPQKVSPVVAQMFKWPLHGREQESSRPSDAVLPVRGSAPGGVTLKHRRITTDFHSVTSETAPTSFHPRHSSSQTSNQLSLPHIYHRIPLSLAPFARDHIIVSLASPTSHPPTFNMAEQAKYYEMYRNAR